MTPYWLCGHFKVTATRPYWDLTCQPRHVSIESGFLLHLKWKCFSFMIYLMMLLESQTIESQIGGCGRKWLGSNWMHYPSICNNEALGNGIRILRHNGWCLPAKIWTKHISNASLSKPAQWSGAEQLDNNQQPHVFPVFQDLTTYTYTCASEWHLQNKMAFTYAQWLHNTISTGGR